MENYFQSAFRSLPLVLAVGGLTGCGEAVMDCEAPSALVKDFETKTAQALLKVTDGITEGNPNILPSGELGFIQDLPDGTHIVSGTEFDPGEGYGGIYKEATIQVLTYATDAADNPVFAFGASLYNSHGWSVPSEEYFKPDSVEIWNDTYINDQGEKEKTESFFRLTVGIDGVPYLAYANAWSVAVDADRESTKWSGVGELCMPLHDVLIDGVNTSASQLNQYALDEAGF